MVVCMMRHENHDLRPDRTIRMWVSANWYCLLVLSIGPQRRVKRATHSGSPLVYYNTPGLLKRHWCYHRRKREGAQNGEDDGFAHGEKENERLNAI